MKQQATATKVNGKWKARVIRSEACASCRACQFGQQEELLVDLPGKDYQEGQQVELETEGREFTKAALWAYGLPLAGLFGGLFAGSALDGYLPFPGEVAQAGGAILGVALCCAVIRWLDRHISKSRRYQPQCRQAREENQSDKNPS